MIENGCGIFIAENVEQAQDVIDCIHNLSEISGQDGFTLANKRKFVVSQGMIPSLQQLWGFSPTKKKLKFNLPMS